MKDPIYDIFASVDVDPKFPSQKIRVNETRQPVYQKQIISEDEIIKLYSQTSVLRARLSQERERIRTAKRPHGLDVLMEERALLGYQILLVQSIGKVNSAGTLALYQAAAALLEANVIAVKTFMGWKE